MAARPLGAALQALVVRPGPPPRLEFVADYPEPTVPPGEVLVRVHRAGVCATDLQIARGYLRFVGVPGHEFVGTVIDGRADWRGQRVVGNRCGPFATALELLRQHQVAVEETITATFPLERGVEALAAAADRDHVKVLLVPGAN